MIIIGYDDLLLLIAMFLMAMVALVIITAVVTYKIVRFRFLPKYTIIQKTEDN